MDKLERNRVFYALFSTALFLVLIWGIHILIEWGGFSDWRKAGNHPRVWSDWWGMITMPFLHGSWSHIGNNSASFVVLNTMLFYFYREVALKVWLYIAVFSSAFVFLFGVFGSNHVGASGVVYGLAFFLFTAGMMDFKHTLLLRVSLLVLFLYGSIIWGIFPIEEHVSWEGHLGGAIAGVVLAVLFRKEFPERPKYRWEIEEELEKLQSEKNLNSPKPANGKTAVVNIYKQFRHRGIDRGF